MPIISPIFHTISAYYSPHELAFHMPSSLWNFHKIIAIALFVLLFPAFKCYLDIPKGLVIKLCGILFVKLSSRF